MPYPTPQNYNSLSQAGYIPQLYASQLLVYFYMATVFAAIANTNYEGQISRQGDKVLIRTLPEAVIFDTYVDMDIPYSNPKAADITLNIDKGKGWAFRADNVEAHQADIPYIEKWSEHFGKQLQVAIDARILTDVFTQVAAVNQGVNAGLKTGVINMGAAAATRLVTPISILNFIVDCRTVLDEQSAPEEDRWMVLPPIMTGMLLQSDLRICALTGDKVSTIRNGKWGKIAGFDIYESNQLNYGPDTAPTNSAGQANAACTAFDVIYGQKEGLTFASQMTEHDLIPNPFKFGKLMRGQQVFGYMVAKQEAVGHAHVGPDMTWTPPNTFY